MKKIIISILIAFLVFGCLGPATDTVPSEQVPGNGTKDTEPETGNGTPVTEPPEPVVPEPNITENETEEEPVIEEKIPTTSKILYQIIDDEISNLKAPHGGPYDTVSYEWETQNPNLDPKLVAISQPIDIFFNDKKEKNLVGLGFQIYTDKMNSSTANGFAIVVNESDVLNPLLNGRFDLDFMVPGLSKELLGCQMVSKDKYLSEINNATIVIYGFDCINVI
jgi:hypothetical protein